MLQRLIGNAAEVVGGGRHDQRQPLKLLGRDLIWVLVGIPRIDPGGSQMEFSGNDQQELFQGQLFENVLRDIFGIHAALCIRPMPTLRVSSGCAIC